ncbi:MAG: inactive transglutaminase family protein [Pseudomonadales bacterium]|nr:inactive transglutaminase family protein [Pseudomonadales bacterium]NNL11017.1 inactive transglutaminase family protein [Pseudomonadales bacterium]NNM10365.1 inactive transglutaminase family protein [Pseudomonadales bacterium]
MSNPPDKGKPSGGDSRRLLDKLKVVPETVSFTRLSPLMILVSILLFAGASLTLLKHKQLFIPFTPDSSNELWLVEAELRFEGKNRPAKISLALPQETPNISLLEESYISRAYGLSVLDDASTQRLATWTRRRAPDQMQSLYYRVDLHRTPSEEVVHSRTGLKVPSFPAIPGYKEPLASAISTTLEQAREQSADIVSFASQLVKTLNDPRNANARVIRNSASDKDWPKRVVEILAGARIPARVIYGLPLQNDFTGKPLQAWIEVHNGRQWQGINSRSGEPGYPGNFFIWSYETSTPYEAFGTRDIALNFSASKRSVSQIDLANYLQRKNDDVFKGLSLDELPVKTQHVYSLLLMLPIGAIVVAFMRVVIGVPTFGTFMPILIALAFRETQIVWGIIMFLIIVGIGLLLRIALANLRLLLVPRLAAMLTIVVLIMLSLTLFSSRMGLEQGLSIGLFPMVIMTLTIERMSIVWEESGARETLKETAGTLVVGILGFFAMNNAQLMHLMHYFPELAFVVLAVCLLLGAYNGYRLSELLRFRDLARSQA